MDIESLVLQMKNSAASVQSFTVDVSDEQARWKPDAESWSILEVINHLYDEEREDFRVHLDFILHRPQEKWPPIDPVGWVTERKYNERDLQESLTNYLAEREQSLAWLRELASDGPPDWDAVGKAPWGTIRAGDMMSAWAAHDLLHLRQLNELHYAYMSAQHEPFSPRYAGEW